MVGRVFGFVIVMAVMLLASQAHAIDSLLKASAKAEKERVKKASKGKATAILTMKAVDSKGEPVVVACVWLARVGNGFQYLRVSDGLLVSSSQDQIARAEGEVLDQPPTTYTAVHLMYCNGTYCKPTISTIAEKAWPADSASR